MAALPVKAMVEEIKKSGFDKYYVDHTLGLWPQAAGGIPFNACEFQSKGDPITDLYEDLAAEQKAKDEEMIRKQQEKMRSAFVFDDEDDDKDDSNSNNDGE